MNENEINPLLKKELEKIQEVPQRGLQASHASRENYLAQIRNLKPMPAAAKPGAKRTPALRRRSWVSRLAAIAAVLLVLLSGLGGTIYAAQASGPDDLLYSVKTLTEEIQVSLENDPQQRLDLYVSFANRRLNEIQSELDSGEEVSEKALALLEKHNEKMLQEAAQMGGQGLDNALRQIEQNLQRQTQMMEKLQGQATDSVAPGLVKAQEKIRERLELVENGIKEPQGFQDKIREQKENSDNPGQGNKEENGSSNKPETPPGQEKKDGKGQGNNQN
jgi:hypothetical protein